MTAPLAAAVWTSGGSTIASGVLAATSAATGIDLAGIAAIIAASAGMVSAVGALVIGLRSKSSSKGDARSEVLMELLEAQIRKDAEDDRRAREDLRRGHEDLERAGEDTRRAGEDTRRGHEDERRAGEQA